MSVSILCDRISAGMSRTVAIENARRLSAKGKRETRHFLRLSLNCEYYHATKRLILSQFCLAKRLAITPRHALLRSDPAWDRCTAPGHPVSGPQRDAAVERIWMVPRKLAGAPDHRPRGGLHIEALRAKQSGQIRIVCWREIQFAQTGLDGDLPKTGHRNDRPA